MEASEIVEALKVHQVEFRCGRLYVTGLYQNGHLFRHFFRILFFPFCKECSVILFEKPSPEVAQSFYDIFTEFPKVSPLEMREGKITFFVSW